MGGKNQTQSAQFAAPATAEEYDYRDRYPDVAQSGMNPYWHYQNYGQKEGRTYGLASQEGEGGGDPYAFMEDFMASFQAQQNAQQEALAKSNAELEAKYAEETRRAKGEAQLDDLFSSRLDAASKAISDTETTMNDELAHAAARGIDYAITPEQKQERINNSFSAYWSEGQEAQYTDYMSQYGTDRHKWTLPVERGKTASTANALPDKDTQVGGTVKRQNPDKTILTGLENEDNAKAKTVLGGA